MKVLAPGKLILSGEHAVVYGHPALAMATNRYVTTTIAPHEASHVVFELPDLSYQNSLQHAELASLYEMINKKYQRFLKKEIGIHEVLETPASLVKVALNLFCEKFQLRQGLKIKVDSTIPVGCGMGSSAATIMSVLYALELSRRVGKAQHAHQPETDQVTTDFSDLLDLALQIENYQHGHSSGFDLEVSLRGGCLFLENKQIHPRRAPHFPMYLINTGTPQNSTGECVSAAAVHFKNSEIGNDFAAVTKMMDVAFQAGNLQNAKEAIRENHQLLTNIGVVPAAIQRFVARVEKSGGAAKVCGAGAVTGDLAGILMVMTEDQAALVNLCQQFRYSMVPVESESRGLHVI